MADTLISTSGHQIIISPSDGSGIATLCITAVNVLLVIIFFILNSRFQSRSLRMARESEWFRNIIFEARRKYIENFFDEVVQAVSRTIAVLKSELTPAQISTGIQNHFTLSFDFAVTSLETEFIDYLPIFSKDLTSRVQEIPFSLQDAITAEFNLMIGTGIFIETNIIDSIRLHRINFYQALFKFDSVLLSPKFFIWSEGDNPGS